MPSPRASAPTQSHGILAIAASTAVLAGALTLALSDEPPGRSDLLPNDRYESPATISTVHESSDVTERVGALLPRWPLSPGEFEPGTVSRRSEELPEVTQSESGFVVTLPSGTPVPTPTVHDGRLYVGGGFSSMEFHCLDARTGEHVWSVDVSDDGPTSAVVSEGVVTFNTESCTLFALDAETGEQLWSWYLSDPLLSSPTVSNGRVYTVYLWEGAVVHDGQETPQPTHMLIAFDLKTGAALWQRPVDSECITAPVATEDSVYMTSYTGRLYQFRQADGQLLSARDMRATTAPVLAGSSLYIGRRADDDETDAIAESIVRCGIDGLPREAIALAWPAPWLDGEIQERASYTDAAGDFESNNGIYGGFGGGFGGPSGGGFHQIPLPGQQTDDTPATKAAGEGSAQEAADEQPGFELTLSIVQRQAISQFGLGNVSTLQAYQGSRPLHWADRNFCCFGDRVACLSADSGQLIWELPLEGDLEEAGGHLGTPPIAAGDSLYVALVDGDLLRIDPVDGEVHTTYSLDAPVRFAPVAADGRLYVGTQDGKVICLHVDDGEATGWPQTGRDAAHTNVYSADAPWKN